MDKIMDQQKINLSSRYIPFFRLTCVFYIYILCYTCGHEKSQNEFVRMKEEFEGIYVRTFGLFHISFFQVFGHIPTLYSIYL